MADDEVESERRVSSEVISIAQRMKQDGNVQKVAEKAAAEIEAEMEEAEEEALETANFLKCLDRCCGNADKSEALGNLKKELDIDWHTKPIEQLQAEYGTWCSSAKRENISFLVQSQKTNTQTPTLEHRYGLQSDSRRGGFGQIRGT